jgi:hypothetical protein
MWRGDVVGLGRKRDVMSLCHALLWTGHVTQSTNFSQVENSLIVEYSNSISQSPMSPGGVVNIYLKNILGFGNLKVKWCTYDSEWESPHKFHSFIILRRRRETTHTPDLDHQGLRHISSKSTHTPIRNVRNCDTPSHTQPDNDSVKCWAAVCR